MFEPYPLSSLLSGWVVTCSFRSHPSSHRYFFPAATTLVRNTGLVSLASMPWNGFITAFNQLSNTSAKNCRIASSVCGLVGLLAIDVLPGMLEAEDREVEAEVGGWEV